MRALLSTIGSRGDVQPLVALALKLREQGDQVRVCAPPDFGKWVTGFGIPFVPIGPEWRRSGMTNPPAGRSAPSAAQIRQFAAAAVAVQFETLAAAMQGCDVVVASTAIQIAAHSAAETQGIPYVFGTLSPAVFPSLHHPPLPLPFPGQQPPPATADNQQLWDQNAKHFNDTFGAALNARRKSAGLAPLDDVRRHVLTDHPWLSADPTLAPWPDPAGLDVWQAGAWILPDERPLRPELEAFLDAGEPPIYFGFGSIAAPQELSNTMIKVARALGRRAIVSRGWAGLVGDRQPDCLSIGEVNQQALFPRVAAVVQHGGAGTTTAAARAGTPQVVIPQVYDQHYFARRVHQLDIGCAHAPVVEPTVESLTAALAYALRPQVAVRAREVAAAIVTDGALAAARRLGALVASPA